MQLEIVNFESTPNQDSVGHDLTDHKWAQLRELLIADELKQIGELRSDLAKLCERVSSREQRIQDVSEVLTAATVQSRDVSNDLSAALQPIVEAQFCATARENPEAMAEALFPVLGPAIRKMVASLFKLNSNGEARPFSVEQVFLIDSESGLPIVHVVHDDAVAEDADMVSGMLNAIQSYVQDAFATPSFDGLNTLEVGGLSVWIEWGPSAVLASVVRGVGPESLRFGLQERLENIHQHYAADLASYDGDTDLFEPLRKELHEFIHSPGVGRAEKTAKLTSKQRFCGWATAVALVVAVIAFVVSKVDQHHWDGYVDQLKRTPGIIVVNENRGFGQYSLQVLRDPLAIDPFSLLEEFPIDKEAVVMQYDLYQALHPSFVLKRAVTVLTPPEAVSLELIGSKLMVTGLITAQWLMEAKRLAPIIAGIDSVEYQSTLLSTEK